MPFCKASSILRNFCLEESTLPEENREKEDKKRFEDIQKKIEKGKLINAANVKFALDYAVREQKRRLETEKKAAAGIKAEEIKPVPITPKKIEKVIAEKPEAREEKPAAPERKIETKKTVEVKKPEAEKKEEVVETKKTEELESEFTNSLFQLGNRLGDGMPAEIAFSRIAESTQGQATQEFFLTVNQNIQQLGMSLDSAIFDKKRGAIIFYPSSLISTSMKILVESVKKGLQVAARSLMSISEYIKNIQKIKHTK